MTRRGLLVAAASLVSIITNGSVAAAAGLKPTWPAANISSSFGSGEFGRWRTDLFGLPSYRYSIDELHDLRARQPELAGSTDAWHQVGNDHIVSDAFNHGYVQLWSQDRRYEWTNRYDARSEHFSGGYGYLRVGDRVISTLFDDRPAGARTMRDFGVGYFHRATAAAGVSIDEYVYAPFGDDPVLLHDVAIRNDSARTRAMSWFEYWDVNPFDQATFTPVPLGPVRWMAGIRALAATQLPTALDRRPLTIFAAALRGPLDQHVGDTRAFFGAGSRASPAAARGDRLDGSLAPGTGVAGGGRAMFGLRAPIRLRPGASITLRYAYGAAHAQAITTLVHRYARAASPLRQSEQQWRAWLPQITIGRRLPWLSRELQWDAYTVRSGATYEDCRGRHVISQGGYYQYALGFQGAFRDPLQHILPMIYADPALARDVLLYSAAEQPRLGGQVPYAMSELCQKFKFGNADDLDLWLLFASAEYGLATRDLQGFDSRVAFADGGQSSLWAHLKLAFDHQESLRGPHGGYFALDTGDWSDLSTSFLGMTESTLVDAQAAYIYPRLAMLADARGDRTFAAELRRAAGRDLLITRGQWVARGWYARGYAGSRRLGTGVIFGENQPWAILAGAPNRAQTRTLIGHIRRFLTGVDAPANLHGPARIGSSQSPAATDPAITEHSALTTSSTGSNSAVFPGGAWYAINGWLTWSLARLGDSDPGARSQSFSEFVRNTLATHAHTYPAHWDGITSVDDVCHAFYSSDAADCGAGLTTSYAGQIMHQPAWSLFDAIKLVGVNPTTRGFEIRPELASGSFSLRLSNIAVAYVPRLARGYVRTAAASSLRMEVAPPSGRRWQVYAAGRPVRYSRHRGLLVFRLNAGPGKRASWEVVGSS